MNCNALNLLLYKRSEHYGQPAPTVSVVFSKSDASTHPTGVCNACMQTPPTAAEAVASVPPRLMSAMEIKPAVLSAVQLKQSASPRVSDDHASKHDSKVRPLQDMASMS